MLLKFGGDRANKPRAAAAHRASDATVTVRMVYSTVPNTVFPSGWGNVWTKEGAGLPSRTEPEKPAT